MGDTPTAGEQRPGEFRRYAIDQALHAARTSVFWNLAFHRTEHGFVDYFEDTAKRNLEMVEGLEELGDDVSRRGIVPQEDGGQAVLATGGGGGGE